MKIIGYYVHDKDRYGLFWSLEHLHFCYGSSVTIFSELDQAKRAIRHTAKWIESADCRADQTVLDAFLSLTVKRMSGTKA